MPYVAPSTKHARLWVDAVSKSLKMDKSTVAQMYARLCEFKSWDRAVEAIGRGEASFTDENISKDVMLTRRQLYAEVLIGEFGMNESMAEYIAEIASPSSAIKPRRFSIDQASLFKPKDDQGTNLRDMFKAFGMDTEEDINKGIEEYARANLADSLPDDFNFDNFAERMRISKPLDPGAWYDLLDTMGWDLVDESFQSDYSYGEESFIAIKDDQEVPVFITSLSRTPYDVDDNMANEVMAIVEERVWDEFDSEEAVLFWGQPTVKKIDGKDYTHFGMYYTEGQWHEFLINRYTSITGLFRQHHEVESIDSPPESLCDEGMALAIAAIEITNHLHESPRMSLRTLTTRSGWNFMLPSAD